MSKIRELSLSRILTLILCLSLTGVDMVAVTGTGGSTGFESALEQYRGGDYSAALSTLEEWPARKGGDSRQEKARVLLLKAACLEKLNRVEEAGDIFRRIKRLLDMGDIDEFPAIEGIDTRALSSYSRVFGGGSFFRHKKPVPVENILSNRVVHSPRSRRLSEVKKKKFPWLWFALGAAVVSTAVVFLLTAGFNEKERPFSDIDWVRIPAGEFMMGDNFGEGDSDELPVHEVYLDEYYISRYEITVDQYNVFTKETGRLGIPIPAGQNFAGTPYPAGSISWQDANDFCRWLSQRTGEDIRLPTEAQWEKAARGTGQFRYPWGNASPDCDKANYDGCPTVNLVRVYPVGRLPNGVSPYGVHDMAGNTWEWCLDVYDAGYYSVSPRRNPQGAGLGVNHVLRGGGWRSGPLDIRCANRLEERNVDLAKIYAGLRVVKIPLQ